MNVLDFYVLICKKINEIQVLKPNKKMPQNKQKNNENFENIWVISK